MAQAQGGGHLNKAKKYEGNVGILDQPMYANQKQKQYFSSLRAENARAVTGRRCPQSEVGEDFLARRP